MRDNLRLCGFFYANEKEFRLNDPRLLVIRSAHTHRCKEGQDSLGDRECSSGTLYPTHMTNVNNFNVLIAHRQRELAR